MQAQVVVLQTKGDTKQSKIEITGEIEDEIPTRIAKILRLAHGHIKRQSWNSGDTRRDVQEQKINMNSHHQQILPFFSVTQS